MKTNVIYPINHHPSTVLVLLILILVALVAFASCESKSGKLNSTPIEKVVIIDSYRLTPSNVESNKLYKYKVKRINHGVVTTIYDQNLYEKGDTIYKRIITL